MRSFTPAQDGLFYIDESPYAQGSVRVRYHGDLVNIRDQYGDVYSNVLFSAIFNNEEQEFFLTLDDLRYFIAENFYK